MSYLRKKLERRTFSQDRYYILIKRQRAGKATFNELTELDEIVNRVPDIREKVIIENFYTGEENEQNTMPGNPPVSSKPEPPRRKSLVDALRSFFHRFLETFIPAREFTALY